MSPGRFESAAVLSLRMIFPSARGFNAVDFLQKPLRNAEPARGKTGRTQIGRCDLAYLRKKSATLDVGLADAVQPPSSSPQRFLGRGRPPPPLSRRTSPGRRRWRRWRSSYANQAAASNRIPRWKQREALRSSPLVRARDSLPDRRVGLRKPTVPALLREFFHVIGMVGKFIHPPQA